MQVPEITREQWQRLTRRLLSQLSPTLHNTAKANVLAFIDYVTPEDFDVAVRDAGQARKTGGGATTETPCRSSDR